MAARVAAPGPGAVADASDFMLLQMLNRAHLRFVHVALLRAAELHRRQPVATGVLPLRPRPASGVFQPADADSAAGPEYRSGAAGLVDRPAAAPVRPDSGTGPGWPADQGRRVHPGGEGRHAAGRPAQTVCAAVQGGLGGENPRSHQPAAAWHSAVRLAGGTAPVAVSRRIRVLPAGRPEPGLADAR